MQFATVCGVFIACIAAAGCGDGADSGPGSSVPINVADAPRLFQQDVQRSFDNSYRVVYDLTIKMDGNTRSCRVAWWKGGTDRQRFDMCAPLVYGDKFDAEPWRILMFGDRDQILVCSSRLPLDPKGELDSGGGGACHEDSSGIGDLAANAIFYLGFPLEYPDALPAGYFDSLSEIKFESARTETIAGRPARCYVVSSSVGDDRSRADECFGDDGAVLARTGNEVFEYTLRATEVGSVSDGDFEQPYPYVNASDQ